MTKMQKYTEIVALKSYLKGSASFNDIDGTEELTEEQWEELHEYALQLADNLAEMKSDSERIDYLIEGVMLHTLIDVIEGNYY